MPPHREAVSRSSSSASALGGNDTGDLPHASVSFDGISPQNLPMGSVRPRRTGRLRSAIQRQNRLQIIPATEPTTPTDDVLNYSEPTPLLLLHRRGLIVPSTSTSTRERETFAAPSSFGIKSSRKPSAVLSPDESRERLISILQAALEPQFAHLKSGNE